MFNEIDWFKRKPIRLNFIDDDFDRIINYLIHEQK